MRVSSINPHSATLMCIRQNSTWVTSSAKINQEGTEPYSTTSSTDSVFQFSGQRISTFLIEGLDYVDSTVPLLNCANVSTMCAFILITNSKFIGNKGGVLLQGCHADSPHCSSVTITSSTFEHNNGYMGGAVVSVNSAYMFSISDSHFNSNAETQYVIAATDVQQILIDGTQFNNNAYSTAVLLCDSPANLVYIADSEFKHNARPDPAVVAVDSSALQIAFSPSHNVPSVLIQEVTFKNCSANNGGAVTLDYDAVLMAQAPRLPTTRFQNCSFFINKADNDGGAVYVSNGYQLYTTLPNAISFYGNIFQGNTAKHRDPIISFSNSYLGFDYLLVDFDQSNLLINNCAPSSCNGHGTCNLDTGYCECYADDERGHWNSSTNTAYDADDHLTDDTYCEICATNYYSVNCTVFCQADQTCSRHGSCESSTGRCRCSYPFHGERCQDVNVGAIVGPVVGGLVFVLSCALAAIAGFIMNRRKSGYQKVSDPNN
eukprot:GEZU01013945.1.p1 GENE.GEZU01013945.1~~GEZU01013945.1.p1  ORF type:complete len:488 (-),score=61.15 GEZU01013945.1:370-1833(-)